ncbi:MAG: serine hydrolase family protein [Candidatus Micrarchaeota archaeon]|nr:serine hydrolase family protein [Candidatus Micrarchaeota archaeon]
MDRVYILHGWEGSPDGNWFQWLKTKLEERGIEVDVPSFPDPAHPDMDAWLVKLREAVGKPDGRCYFVGHSLGSITILRYLEALDGDAHIGGSVLVAGFTDDLGIKELAGFYRKPIEWDRIRGACGRFVVIASDDDQYVPLRHADILENELRAKKIIEPNMGHFNMKELHVVLNELLKIMQG